MFADVEFLADRPSWFLLGPCLGLLVVGLLATLNVRIGVLGGWADLLDRAQGRQAASRGRAGSSSA